MSRRKSPKPQSKKSASKRIDLFFAYPSSPVALGETINNAISSLRTSKIVEQDNVTFTPWPELAVAGRSIIDQILQRIDRAEVFTCDLTYLNSNVAFELGYAIAKFKRIWITLDTGIADAVRNYKTIFTTLIGIGYVPYENSSELVSAFITDPPWRESENKLLGDIHRTNIVRPEYPSILYLKPSIDTNAVVNVVQYLRGSMFAEGLIIDDPRENPSPTLTWYVDKIRSADAIVVHLLGTEHLNSGSHNVARSFVAGIARGFGRPLLIIAHSPFVSPLDYQDLLKVHSTAAQCVNFLDNWIREISLSIPRRRPRRQSGTGRALSNLGIRDLAIGEAVAEQEDRQLDDYFVETNLFQEALTGRNLIFVGRRGTGKTATLLALRSHFIQDRRNHVCIIKPVGYEVDGLVRLLEENIHRAERGYLIESLWKYLIYSELAISVSNEIMARPVYQESLPAELRLIEYLSYRKDIFELPFSQRLDEAVRRLVGLEKLATATEQKARISELLHTSDLRNLRELLGYALHDRSKVVILVDNLDEHWIPGQNIELLSDLLFGLLRLGQDITDEFRRHDYWRESVDIVIDMFIRSDIFAHMQHHAPEQDKLPIRRMSWANSDLLIRIVDLRLAYGTKTTIDVSEIWSRLFPSEVAGLPTREFILSNVLPRPRDVIFLMKEAIGEAINRGSAEVTALDFLDARIKYSAWVFNSILAEDDPRKNRLENVLFEFAGAPRQMTRGEVYNRISKGGVEDNDIDYYLDLLCDTNFLGIQTVNGMQFSTNEEERRMLREVARRVALERGWGEESYEVKPAFWHVLQID